MYYWKIILNAYYNSSFFFTHPLTRSAQVPYHLKFAFHEWPGILKWTILTQPNHGRSDDTHQHTLAALAGSNFPQYKWCSVFCCRPWSESCKCMLPWLPTPHPNRIFGSCSLLGLEEAWSTLGGKKNGRSVRDWFGVSVEEVNAGSSEGWVLERG